VPGARENALLGLPRSDILRALDRQFAAIFIEKNILTKVELDQKLAGFESKWAEP